MLAEPESVSISENSDPKLVPAVERAVRVLDALAGARQPLPLAQLARTLALPKSSVHGLLGTLTSLGLARRNAQGEFALGAKPLQWAEAYAAQSDVLRAFDAHAGRFAALQPETVMLAVLDGADVMYLACRQGSRPLAVNFRVGGRFPASCTSSGKAILSTFAPEQVRALVSDGGLRRLTRHSLGSVAALLRQLDGFRDQGYALDDEETAEGMFCLGAPVFAARRGTAVAAVAVCAIKAAVTPKRRTELVTAIRRLAEAISAELGGGNAATAAANQGRGLAR